MHDERDQDVDIRAMGSVLENHYLTSDDDDASYDSLLVLALRAARGEQDVAAARHQVRRSADLSASGIRRASEVALEIGDQNPVEAYVLWELIQAAAVAHLGLVSRSKASLELAASADRLGHHEVARVAFVDAIEGGWIAKRFQWRYPPVSDPVSPLAGTSDPNEQIFPPVDVFDSEDPVRELVSLIEWNSDRAGGEGVLAQVDATQRLAFRLDRWREAHGDLSGLAKDVALGCRSAAGEGSFIRSRYLLSLGDALAQVGEFEVAGEFLQEVWFSDLLFQHPMGALALIRDAQCQLMLGDIRACRARLDSVDRTGLKTLGEFVITVAAALVRFHVVDRACRYWQGQAVPDPEEDIAPLLRRVAAVTSTSREDSRSLYLRNLYFAVLLRDVNALLGVSD